MGYCSGGETADGIVLEKRVDCVVGVERRGCEVVLRFLDCGVVSVASIIE